MVLTPQTKYVIVITRRTRLLDLPPDTKIRLLDLPRPSIGDFAPIDEVKRRSIPFGLPFGSSLKALQKRWLFSEIEPKKP